MENDPMNELSEFDQKMEQLRKQLKELELEKEKKKKEIEAKTPVKIKITDYEENYGTPYFKLTIKPERDDVIKGLSQVVTKSYYNDSFTLMAMQIAKFIEITNALPNIERTASKEIKEILDEYTDLSWDYKVYMDDKHIIVRNNIRTRPSLYLGDIPGRDYEQNKRLYKFPKQEGWRVYSELLKDKDKKVEYDPACLEFLLEQVEEREELNKIATMESYPPYLEEDFNGNKLKPFQSVGVRFAMLNGGRALIADEMGLGKTLQALAYRRFKARIDYPNDPSQFKTLIVCPAHLVYNWFREIKKYNGQEAKIIVLRGLVPDKVDAARVIRRDYDFCIVSYNLLGKEHKLKGSKEINDEGYLVEEEDTVENLWVSVLNVMPFDLIIYDEIHYAGVAKSGRSKAARKLHSKYVLELSGTPLVNRPPDLWPLLNILKKEIFYSQGDFVRTYTYDGKTPRNTRELQEVLRTLMIRRLKKDVLKDLPPVNRVPRYHELSPKAARVYNKALQGIAEYIDALGERYEARIPNILSMISKLRFICGIDKIPTTGELTTEILDNNKEDDHRKIIIFSFWKATTKKLEQVTREDGSISFVDDNVNTVPVPKRYDICDEFTNNPNLFILTAPLMSTQEGLNITAAGSAIFNDMWWNPKAHEQAEGRAYGRLLDPHSLDSYYVLASNTIDEHIWDLVWGEKAGIIKEVVDGVEVDRSNSIARKLIELLREDARKLKGGD